MVAAATDVVDVFEVATELVTVAVAVAVEALFDVVAVADPVKAQLHSFESALGLLEQFEAHAGSADVAVTVDWVKVLQNADAVAVLAEM